MSRPGVARVAATLAVMAVAQLACAVPSVVLPRPRPPVRMVVIQGGVYGDSAPQQESGHSVGVPLAATVTCNGTTALAGSDGRYSVSVPAAAQYTCLAAAPDYAPGSASLPATTGTALTLNFGPASVSVCAAAQPAGTATPTTTANPVATPPATATATTGAAAVPAGMACPELHLQPGSLAGTVTYSDTHQPAPGVTVQCWNPSAAPPADANMLHFYTAHTDASGTYTLSAVSVDHYMCQAGDDVVPHEVSVGPHQAASLNLAMCHSNCPAVTFHGGAVMHSLTVYLIFWLPHGYRYDAQGSAHYESLMQRYFHDVGGTSFYNIVTQYWDYQAGWIESSVQVGGTYVDTRPYDRPATSSSPLYDADITAEVGQAMVANHWTADPTHAFFVFTGYGAEVCTNSTRSSCSFGKGKHVFCGYHSYSNDAQQAIYAEIVDNFTCDGSLYSNLYVSPNGDWIADEQISVVSHEQFEMVSDPTITAWWAGTSEDGEIADKCYTVFGSFRSDGSNITLAHGHTYIVQAEWSDRSNTCVFRL